MQTMIDANFHRRLAKLSAIDASIWRDRKIGLEKESLRVDSDGGLSKKSHPAVLGEPLTHPFIKTDYSEAMLELVTPPQPSSAAAVQCLSILHQHVSEHLAGELLWPFSMPCVMTPEVQIPIAQYGESNDGQFQSIYRNGLGLRYGRRMQLIAGVHFNFSLGDHYWQQCHTLLADKREQALSLSNYMNEQYFAMIRNVHRYAWVLNYLLGASPVICKSFLDRDYDWMKPAGPNSVYAQHATTLRMSDLGYQNNQQDSLSISLDGLPAFCRSLKHAVSTSHPPYAKIGIVENGDQYRQLNDYLLQSEAEYYTPVRPKANVVSGVRSLLALQQQGVRYVELRVVDLQYQSPIGVDRLTCLFLELFLQFCHLHPSPVIDQAEHKSLQAERRKVALAGRDPDIKIQAKEPIKQALADILNACASLAEQISNTTGNVDYQQSVAMMQKRLEDSHQLPSQSLLDLLSDKQQSFIEFGLAVATNYRHYFEQLFAPGADTKHWLESAVAQSRLDQQALSEASKDINFSEFLATHRQQLDNIN
ncbi:MAG: glutamate--cysteine ligase [Gammaproteobacteria bacterium]|nr:glutamate--cysteine ligase [Gammaproteobacteria bacterium]